MPFPSITIPDTKIYIYDIDMDNFMQFEISPNRIPVEAFWDQIDARLLAVECEYAKLNSEASGSKGDKAGNAEEQKSAADAFNAIKVEEIEDDFRPKKEEF